MSTVVVWEVWPGADGTVLVGVGPRVPRHNEDGMQDGAHVPLWPLSLEAARNLAVELALVADDLGQAAPLVPPDAPSS